MENTFNKEALEIIVKKNKDDKEVLELILDILNNFEEYHSRIYYMETKRMLYTSENMDGDEYRTMVAELDGMRTAHHNSVLAGVGVLNRLAEQAGTDPVYAGVVSKERPYRREVANAILDYVRTIIDNRI